MISKSIIRDFSAKHKDAEIALQKWYEETKTSNWKNFTEVKKTFNTTDSVGNDSICF